MDFDNYENKKTLFRSQTPKLNQWLVKCSGGLIKEKDANYVLIGFIILAISISIILLFDNNKKQKLFTPAAEAPIEDVISK